MSDSLFHFIFPFLAIMATGLKMKHKIAVALILASLAVFLDIDHFFGMVARGTLHNVFITLALPLALFAIAMLYERRGDFWKHVTLIAALVLFSHTAVDLFVGGDGVVIFYPISNQSYLFDFINVPVTLPSGIEAKIISSEGVGLTIFTLFVFGIIFTEDFVRILKRDKSVPRAVEDTIKFERIKLNKEF